MLRFDSFSKHSFHYYRKAAQLIQNKYQTEITAVGGAWFLKKMKKLPPIKIQRLSKRDNLEEGENPYTSLESKQYLE